MKHYITRGHFTMNHIFMTAMVLVMSLVCATSLEARKPAEFTISTPENVSLRHEGGNVIIQMDLPLKMVKVTNNEAAIFTPVLRYGTHVLPLKSVGVYGRTRYYQYIRSTGLITGDSEINFIRGTQPAVYQYSEKISFRPWMENASLTLEQKLYECCEEVKDQIVIALNAKMIDPNQLASNPSSAYSNSYYGSDNSGYGGSSNYYGGGSNVSTPSQAYSNSNTGYASQNAETPYFDINVTSDDAEAKAAGRTNSTSSNPYGEVTHVTSPSMAAATTTYGSTPSYSESSSNSNAYAAQNPTSQIEDSSWPPIATGNKSAAYSSSTSGAYAAQNPTSQIEDSSWPPIATGNKSAAYSSSTSGAYAAQNPTSQIEDSSWPPIATGNRSAATSSSNSNAYASQNPTSQIEDSSWPPIATGNKSAAYSSPTSGAYASQNPTSQIEDSAWPPIATGNKSAASTSSSSYSGSSTSGSSVQHVTTPAMAASVNVYGDTPSYSTNPMTSSSGSYYSGSSNTSGSYYDDMSPMESPKVGYISNEELVATAESARSREREREVPATDQASSWPSASSSSSSSNSANAEVHHVTTPAMAASVNVYGNTPSYSTNPMTSSSSSSYSGSNSSYSGSNSSSYSSSNSSYYSDSTSSTNARPQAQPTNNWPSTSSAVAEAAGSNAEVHHVTTPAMAASVNVYGNTPSMSGNSNSYASNNSNSYASGSSSYGNSSYDSYKSYDSYDSSNHGNSYSYSPSTSGHGTLTQTAVNNAPGAIVPQYLYYKVQRTKRADVTETDTVLIEFFQRSTDLSPTYRDNLQVLNRLINRIDQLRNNPDIAMKNITITTYSSPEGMLPDNKKMVSERVQSIKSYLMSKCNIPSSMIRTETVPENWYGLRQYVESHSMPHRDAILRLIDGQREPDNKEWVLKSTYADVYPTLLNDVYPGLRYTIIDFDFDINKFNDPSQEIRYVDANNRVMPLDDIFALAQQYPEGSMKAQEIYLKAAHYYSSNRKANYNAAVALLQGGNPEEAKKYITGAGESPDVYYTRGLIYMALGDYQTARDYMKLAYNEGVPQADVIFQYLRNKVI